MVAVPVAQSSSRRVGRYPAMSAAIAGRRPCAGRRVSTRGALCTVPESIVFEVGNHHEWLRAIEQQDRAA